MTQARFIMDLNGILVQAVFWISLGFVVGVSMFWPWWKTDLGWTIILKTAAIGAILLPFNLHVMLDVNVRTLFWQWWTAITFGLVGVVIIWRFIVMWALQRFNPPPTKSGRRMYRERRKIEADRIGEAQR